MFYVRGFEGGEAFAQGFDGDGTQAVPGEQFDLRENVGAAVDAAGRAVRFGGDVEELERELHRLLFVALRGRLAAPAVDPLQDAARGGRAGAGDGEIDRLELRAERVVEIEARVGLIDAGRARRGSGTTTPTPCRVMGRLSLISLPRARTLALRLSGWSWLRR